MAWFGSRESYFVNLPGSDSRQMGMSRNGKRGAPTPFYVRRNSVLIAGYNVTLSSRTQTAKLADKQAPDEGTETITSWSL
jgi:hypothetical protein